MAASLEFLLNGEPVVETGFEPHTTLLEWLREERGLTGCKEGCAEGDCGACMVVIAEPEPQRPERLRWRSINACIQLLPMLHGKAVFTVEGLKNGERLHPIQQMLVDHHGSQCGFCTPGFVMSIYGLMQRQGRPGRADTLRALSGNLCRCTGYRPIIDAALALSDCRMPAAEQAALCRRLQRIERRPGMVWASFIPGGSRWHAPASLDELARLFARYPDALLVAGSSDVGLWINKRLEDPPRMIGLAAVPELQVIRERADGLQIGAAVCLEQAFEAIGRVHPSLIRYFDRFASLPVRQAGTLAGNLANASPIGDAAPVLLALDARLLLNRDGARRELPLDAFFIDYRRTALQPGEFIEAVLLPAPPPDLELAAWKLSRREEQDIAAVSLALAIRRAPDGGIIHARVAAGGMAAIPKRAPATEQALLGQVWDDASLRSACAALARDFTPQDDLRASADYRLAAARNLLTRFRMRATGTRQPLTLDELEAAT